MTSTDIRKDFVRVLGAHQVWVLGARALALLSRDALPETTLFAAPLEGVPVTCVDLRALGERARTTGVPLVVDATLPGVRACAANRLGAHVAYAKLSDDLCVVGLSRDCAQVLADLPHQLEAMACVSERELQRAYDLVQETDDRWRASSDSAQVVATYLRCHPRIAEVRYPGLKRDPSFAVAARTLSCGFGPLVDYRREGSDGWQREICGAEEVHTQILRLEQALAGE